MTARQEQARRIIFHADDFGMNSRVNRGILTAFRDGLLTSTSLMTNAPAAESAVREWPELNAEHAAEQLRSSQMRQSLDEPSLPFDLGIHLNLTQGSPLTAGRFPASLLDEKGDFLGIGRLFFRLIQANSTTLTRVAAELRAQIEWMCDRNLRPTHLNGHQYIELIPGIAKIIPQLMQDYSIPVVRVARETGLTRSVLSQGRLAAWGLGLVKRSYAHQFRRRMLANQSRFPDRFFGTSHAGIIDQSIFAIFLRAPLENETVEIGIHPGDVGSPDDAELPPAWFDPLMLLRPSERDWLCGSELPQYLLDNNLMLGRLQGLGAVR